MNRLGFSIGLVTTVSLGAQVPAPAQAPWGPSGDSRSLSVEAIRASFDDIDLSFPSPILYLGGRFPLGDGVTLVADVPLALLAARGASATVLGNPYVGVTLGTGSGSGGDLGLRVPLASESGDLFGSGQSLAAFADFDRFEAWPEDFTSASGHVTYRKLSPGGLQTGIAVGASLWAPRDRDNELLADYRADLGYREQRFALAAEFTGRAVLTESDLSVGERTFHQFAVGAGVALGRVWSTLFVRFPLDDDLKRTGFNSAVGVAAALSL
jgi:hypothetical protein